ncbi:hypothetical protein BD410DRAFT_808886 [Rickenella mellea]|uniref:Uncharacterized protein n=1 Tax=Rickenella mellea TaxID=50990 RepID=A0A4Y7PKW2_9AGAM|nr:hypothetical protein BD410DRAFT_808886 [Rickenella mellea]
MSDAKVCMGIMPNPDVAGLGIRIGLYITVFLLAVIPRIPRTQELIESLLNNTRVYTLALLLTAIIQTAQGQLTLYHAALIYHLFMVLALTLLPTPSEFNGRGSVRLAIFTFSSFLSYAAWSLRVWSTALTFGSQPECNHSTKYVIVWVTVRVTATWMRRFWIAWTVIVSFYVFVITIGFVLAYCCSSSSDRASSLHNASGDGDGRMDWDDVPLIVLGVQLRLMYFTYGVVMLELTATNSCLEQIKRNNVLPGESVWSFGQILSVVLLLGFFNDAIKWYNDGAGSPPSADTNPQPATSSATTANLSTPGVATGTNTSGGDIKLKSADAPSATIPATTPAPTTSPDTTANPSTSRSASGPTEKARHPATSSSIPAANPSPTTSLAITALPSRSHSVPSLPLRGPRRSLIRRLTFSVFGSNLAEPNSNSNPIGGSVDLELGSVSDLPSGKRRSRSRHGNCVNCLCR